jgi:hypothetical protein
MVPSSVVTLTPRVTSKAGIMRKGHPAQTRDRRGAPNELLPHQLLHARETQGVSHVKHIVYSCDESGLPWGSVFVGNIRGRDRVLQEPG